MFFFKPPDKYLAPSPPIRLSDRFSVKSVWGTSGHELHSRWEYIEQYYFVSPQVITKSARTFVSNLIVGQIEYGKCLFWWSIEWVQARCKRKTSHLPCCLVRHSLDVVHRRHQSHSFQAIIHWETIKRPSHSNYVFSKGEKISLNVFVRLPQALTLLRFQFHYRQVSESPMTENDTKWDWLKIEKQSNSPYFSVMRQQDDLLLYCRFDSYTDQA